MKKSTISLMPYPNSDWKQQQIQFQYYEYTPEKNEISKHGGYYYQLDLTL